MENPITKTWTATLQSWQGLKAAYKHQWPIRAELVIAAIATPVAFFLGQNALQIALLISALVLVFIVELINSAIETIVDRISLDRHELSGRAKDLGSAAVLLAGVYAVVIWLGMLIERF